MRRIKGFIYSLPNWPNFDWDFERLLPLIGEVRNLQGKLTGKMEALGFKLQNEAYLETLSLDILKSSEIEGEYLNLDQVRSSIATRLGMDISGLIPSDRYVDGVVDMMLDATRNYDDELTDERLFGWHSSLFPGGRSGMFKITVGNYREESAGPMHVVSGAMGKEKVHFQAPSSDVLGSEMAVFLNWFNKENNNTDPVLKAGVAHLWFVTIHPFDDGNGRIARALTDMFLTKSEKTEQRFYSMSSQIRKERKEYYRLLEKTQKGSLNITDWLVWFCECLKKAILESDVIVNKVLFKHTFWNEHASTLLNKRQVKILNLLLDGFTGKLTSSKWAKINKCSSDTALRDIQDLIKKDILTKEAAGGRSTNYELKFPTR